MKKILSVVIIMVMALGLFSGCGSAKDSEKQASDTNGQSYEIRLAHVCGIGSPYDYGANIFKKLVEEQSDGRITVAVHAGDLTTDEIEGVEMVQSSNLEIFWCGTGSLGGFVPDVAIFEMPFLFKDPAHVERALASDFGTKILDEVSGVENIEAIAFHEDGWRNILTKDVVINSLADLKGVRIRSMMNDICVDMYKALGAIPVTISSGEIYTSLQTGLVDGEDNSFLYADSDGYIEQINAAAMVHHFYSSGFVLTNDKWFNSLTPEDQELIRNAAIEAGKEQRAWFLDADTKMMEKYKAQGCTVTYPEDIDAWRDAVQPVYTKYYEKYPEWKELVKTIEDLRDK